MRMLEMNFFSAPPMRNLIQRNLDYFCCSVVDPGDTALIEADMIASYCWHTQIVTVYPSTALIQRPKFDNPAGHINDDKKVDVRSTQLEEVIEREHAG